MEKLILNYLGEDNWSRPVFQDQNGKIFKDLNCGDGKLDLCTAGSFDGEPDTPLRYIKKYENIEVELLGMEDVPTNEEKFNYMRLSRLQNDCKYYLGNGNKNNKYLHGESVESHINEMKRIYNSFTDNKKPEWITLNEITETEKQMLI